jgi:hypothetical protein
MLVPGLVLGGGRRVCKGNSSAFAVLIERCALRFCVRKMVWTTVYDRDESMVVTVAVYSMAFGNCLLAAGGFGRAAPSGGGRGREHPPGPHVRPRHPVQGALRAPLGDHLHDR